MAAASTNAASTGGNANAVQEVLPKAGLVYSEKSSLSEILSKPKILPLKSITLERIEEMEAKARKIFEETRPMTGSQRPSTASGGGGAAAGDRPSTASGRQNQGRSNSGAGLGGSVKAPS